MNEEKKTYSFKDPNDLYELVVIKEMTLDEVVQVVKEDVARSQLFYFLGKYSIPYKNGVCYDSFMEHTVEEVKDALKNNKYLQKKDVAEKNDINILEDRLVRYFKKFSRGERESIDIEVPHINKLKHMNKKMAGLYILNILTLISFIIYIIVN